MKQTESKRFKKLKQGLIIACVTSAMLLVTACTPKAAEDKADSKVTTGNTSSAVSTESQEATTENKAKADKLTVAVSIVPQKTFVEKIAGDAVDIVTMIPAGNSPANYAPTPQIMEQFSKAAVYFGIGVPTEEANIMPRLADYPNIKVVKLQDVVESVYEPILFGEEHHHDDEDDDHHDEDGDHHDEDGDHHDEDGDHHDEDGDHHDEDGDHHDEDGDHHDEDGDHHDEHEGHSHEAGSKDPHIWMSPKRVIVMVDEMAKVLAELDPENASTYTTNAKKYIEELKAVDEEISGKFKFLEGIKFLIGHPSMGYFAADYKLEMHALEQNGKDATAQYLQELIDFAKEEDIHVVFYQAEFDASQVNQLVEEIKGEAVKIDPLSADYIPNLKSIAQTFFDTYMEENSNDDN